METYEEFVMGHSERLLQFAYAVSGNPHDAWDLLQEAVMRLAKPGRYEQVHEPYAYARRAIANAHVDLVRRRRREVLTAEFPDVVDHIQDDQAGSMTLKALSVLSPKERTVLALRHLEGMTDGEIARFLKCRRTTVRSHASRGGEKARAFLTSIYTETEV